MTAYSPLRQTLPGISDFNAKTRRRRGAKRQRLDERNSLFEAQALTYLRLCDLRLALVINFGERLVRQGIHRVVNGLQESEYPQSLAFLRLCVPAPLR